MSLDPKGSLFAMLDPLKRVYDYLKGVKETREIQQRLMAVLHSLELFADSAKESEKSGKALMARSDALNPPISIRDVEDLMRLSTDFFSDFRIFLSSICEFGKECNDLMSGDFEVFMQQVMVRKPDVYAIMAFFGRNYNPNTKELDLTRLPTLIKIYGPKGMWKENKDLSKVVAEGRDRVNRFMEKMKIIRTQRFIIKDRALIVGFFHSFRRLTREAKRLRSNKDALKELRRAAPSWYLELTDIVEDVRKALPGGSRTALPS